MLSRCEWKAKAAKGEIPVLYSLKLLRIVGLGWLCTFWILRSCCQAANLPCRVSIAPAALVTVVSKLNHILPLHPLPQWKQEVFCSDLAFPQIRLYLSKPCQTFSSNSYVRPDRRVGRFLWSHQVVRKALVLQPSRHKRRRQQQRRQWQQHQWFCDLLLNAIALWHFTVDGPSVLVGLQCHDISWFKSRYTGSANWQKSTLWGKTVENQAEVKSLIPRRPSRTSKALQMHFRWTKRRGYPCNY